MAQAIGVEIVADATKYERALARAEKASTRFKKNVESGDVAASKTSRALSSIGTAFPTARFLGTAGVVAALTESVKAASNFNEMVTKTDAIFGQSAQSVQDWSKTTTTAFGISQREALATVSSFGALFAPIGIVGEQAAKQSEKLTELGGDLAAFYDTDVASALDAVRSGLVGESEPLRRYGVQLSEARVQAEAMAASGKKHASELTNQEKALARIKIIFDDTAIAQGNFGDTSDDLAGQTKILSAEIDNLKVAVGEGLVPALTGIVGAFNDVYNAAVRVNDWFQKHHLGFLTKGAKDINSGDSLANQLKDATAAGAAGVPGMAGPVKPAAAAAAGAAQVAASTKKAAAATKQAAMSANELAARRNDWFDAMVGRGLGRVQDLSSLQAQLVELHRIGVLVQNRMLATKDITRALALEDQLIEINRQMAGVREQAAAQAVEHERKMADLAAQRKQAAADRFQNTLDWLEFAVEKADATKGIADDIAAEKKVIAALKARIKVVGRNLDLQRQLFRAEQALKTLRNQGKTTGGVPGGTRAPFRAWGTGSNPFGTGGAVGGIGGTAASGTNALVRRGGGFVVVNQHFNAPTTDRHREARYALNATRAVFDG
jgi:hypothetical protein